MPLAVDRLYMSSERHFRMGMLRTHPAMLQVSKGSPQLGIY